MTPVEGLDERATEPDVDPGPCCAWPDGYAGLVRDDPDYRQAILPPAPAGCS